eukprot:6187985-Pleurochrysis_carterae.AAC.1
MQQRGNTSEQMRHHCRTAGATRLLALIAAPRLRASGRGAERGRGRGLRLREPMRRQPGGQRRQHDRAEGDAAESGVARRLRRARRHSVKHASDGGGGGAENAMCTRGVKQKSKGMGRTSADSEGTNATS